MIGVPAGPLDDDPGVRPMAHIFVGSKAPWYDVPAGLPQFEAYPPSIDAPALADLPTRDAAGAGTRGSCLCGGVGYVVTGPVLRSQHCHCSRCRKARAAAHGSNFFTAIDDVRFTRGEGLLSSYKVPEARFFKSVFCRTCGSPMPRHDPERGIAAVPMGGLDDDPGIRPARHIFTASKAPWFDIADDLPQFPEMAPNL
jgi:hypothetical protein